MNSIVFVLALLLYVPSIKAASSGWDDHATHVAIFQSVNVLILLGACYYFLKDAVLVFFKNRWLAYQQSAEAAQKELITAQSSFNEIQASLTKVENTWTEVLARAEVEAVDSRKLTIANTEELVAKMLRDGRKGLEQEYTRLQQEIYSDIVTLVKAEVSRQMKTQLTSDDHKKLQKDFNQSVQGV